MPTRVEITRRTDYALRIILALARQPEGPALSSRELGRLQEVPHPFARGILTQLARAGLVISRRGSGGGVLLARPAAQISVLDVMEALEGPLTLNLCTRDPDYCGRADACVMHQVWLETERLLRAHLGDKDMAALASGSPAPWTAAAGCGPDLGRAGEAVG